MLVILWGKKMFKSKKLSNVFFFQCFRGKILGETKVNMPINANCVRIMIIRKTVRNVV